MLILYSQWLHFLFKMLKISSKTFMPLIKESFRKPACSFHMRSYSSSDSIQIRKMGSVMCIGLNRPEMKNRFNIDMMRSLRESINQFEKDGSVHVAVLHGEGGTFSYGYDLNELEENPQYFTNIEEIGLLDIFTSKPIVAAINGYAVGFAFDIALWCDFRIVEDTAVMGGYARKLGVPISDTIANRLYSNLGMHKAMDLILTGRVLKAKEAFETGIATRIVACGTALGQAVSFSNSLANMPQACLKADRATFISLSGKYNSADSRDHILKLKNNQKKQALEEAAKGLHVTQSEDVRKKKEF